MSSLDVDAMIARFKARADATRERSLPPVEGEQRRRFMEQREIDFLDYNLIGHAEWEVADEHLVLRIPLRPRT